jgi:uncharacterized protein YceK
MRSLLVILALVSLTLAGCGTFADAMCGPINDHIYYRGVRLDVAAIQEGGPKVLLAADLPFSAVADTLLVPSIAYRELTTPPPGNPSSSIQEQPAADQGRSAPIRVVPKE